MRNSRLGRFRVWDRSQDAFSGEDLVYNFDEIDKLIGGRGGFEGTTGNVYNGQAASWLGPGDVIPALASPNGPGSGPQYPGNTNSGLELQSGKRTLYSVVSGLNYNDVPLGTVIAWWRPASTFPIPDGWQPCDGSIITDHSYGEAPITLPDLRNKFILGADPAVAGINAVNGYVHEASATKAKSDNNVWTGAKASTSAAGASGIGYDSGLDTTAGSNKVRSLSHWHTPDSANPLKIRDHYHDIAHTHPVPQHKHPIADHVHRFVHVHLTPNHVHNFGLTKDFVTNPAPWGQGYFVRVKESNVQGNPFVATADHKHGINVSASNTTGDRDPLPDARGFAPNGPAASPWGYGGNPLAYSWPGSYTSSNPTSYPTKLNISGSSISAHAENFYTERSFVSDDTYRIGNGTSLRSTEDSPVVSTKDTTVDGTTLVRSGNIINDTETLKQESRKLDGITSDAVQTSGGAFELDPRTQYVGMLYLMKVKVSTNVI